MSSLRRAALGATALAAAAALALVPSGAPAAPKVPQVKTRIAKVRVDLAGYVEIKRLHDTTSDCFPGESWTQTNTYDFETSKYVNVSLKRISGPGLPTPVTTSPFSAVTGRARNEGRITGYRTTNYCDPSQAPGPVKPAPTCTVNTGRVSVALEEGATPTSGDPDLAPLRSAAMLLAVKRVGGTREADECLGGGPDQLVGPDTDKAVLSTSLAPGYPTVITPTGFDGIKLFNIRPGQKLRKTIVASGPCSKVTLSIAPGGSSASPPEGALNADGDCFFRARIVYTITPRPRKR